MTYNQWLKTVCFQKPTPEADDLARDAWKEAQKHIIAERLPDVNPAMIRNLSDDEFLRHIDVCDDTIVVELARRLQLSTR